MKLVFVTDNGFSKKNSKYFYSGANIQHYSTVTQHFEEITFIARNKPFDPSGNQISDKYRVHLVDSVTNGRNAIKNIKKLNKLLDDEIKNCDIVMCFGINGYFAYKKAKKYNKPTISYVGGCVYDILRSMDSKFKRMSAPIIMSMIKEMVNNSSYVHYVDKYLLDKYPTKGKYLVCPSAKIEIDENVLKKRIEKIQSQEGTITIGLIGYTHNKIKGIDTAIKALKNLGKQFKLQVVGRGNHKWLIDLARLYKVENQVEFLGVLQGRDEVFKWLDSIDIYIQPSITEGMPRATIEALSRGCPVVATNVGGLKSIVNERYRINVGDYNGLTRKIKEMAEDKSLMVEVGIENFQKAKEFSAEKLNAKRDDFYKNILSHVTKNRSINGI